MLLSSSYRIQQSAKFKLKKSLLKNNPVLNKSKDRHKPWLRFREDLTYVYFTTLHRSYALK